MGAGQFCYLLLETTGFLFQAYYGSTKSEPHFVNGQLFSRTAGFRVGSGGVLDSGVYDHSFSQIAHGSLGKSLEELPHVLVDKN